MGGGVPAVDIAEKEKEYEVTAELPGLDENNIDVKFADGTLTIKGEKKEEKEEKKKDYYLSERRYRLVPALVPPARRRRCRQDRGQASRTACSRVTLPKTAEAQKSEKKITIKAA